MYRELVLASAERVFAARGFAGAAMQEVASEAGISLKTLYATFRGKEEIYREIAERRRQEFIQTVAGAVRPDGSVLDRMRQGIRAYVEFLLSHREYLAIQLHEGRGWGLDPADESRGVWQSGRDLQAALVRAGIAEGIFHDGDPELMAATAIAIMQVQLAGLVERSKKPDAETISDAIVGELERYLCRAPNEAPGVSRGSASAARPRARRALPA